MSGETETDSRGKAGGDAAAKDDLSLVIVWSRAEPHRAGEVALVPPGAPAVLGRGAGRTDDAEPRLAFLPRRGSTTDAPAPLSSTVLSRRQLLVSSEDEALALERVGRLPMCVNGRQLERAQVSVGDVVELGSELVLACQALGGVRLVGGRSPSFAFGEPDRFGIVGESSRIWALRDEIEFYARRQGHVLITGPSGGGKELAARAIHGSSARSSGPFVSRNTATLPPGIIDAELFGNARNFPNPGMRERRGLVGEADGGTLFLDEIGEVPEALQAHFLRLLDCGEYHRLGEDKARVADVRIIAATNRDASVLKHDLVARLKLRLDAPGLDVRRDDIPLLLRAILRQIGASDAHLASRFFEGGEPRVDTELVVALLEHQFTTHVRELESLLLLSMAGSGQGSLQRTPAVSERLVIEKRADRVPGREEIEAALASSGGNVSRAFRALGLSSRDALNRLIRKHGIRPAGAAVKPDKPQAR